jgi:hypothetical protein
MLECNIPILEILKKKRKYRSYRRTNILKMRDYQKKYILTNTHGQFILNEAEIVQRSGEKYFWFTVVAANIKRL